jgi:UDP-N-acetylmuramoylalanine--D-glutamate ligase
MKYAVYGVGVSGMSAIKFLKKLGHTAQVVNSGEPNTWSNLQEILEYVPLENCHSQLNAVELLGEMDTIILSPGISLKNPTLIKARENRVQIINEVELAVSQIEVPIVAVTGTNGKTTTCMMVHEALQRAGFKVFLGGNIGTPVCDFVLSGEHYDYAVLELSSFQLETIKNFRSVVSIITNVSPSHMERYDNFNEYYQAKLRIIENNRSQDLILVDQKLSSDIVKKYEVIHPLDGYDFTHTKLLGEHNKKNFYCAKRVLDYFEVSNKDEVMQELINEFNPVEHRLEFIGQKEGRDFYNDSKSTNFTSTSVALNSFKDKKVCLILGGQLREEKTQALAALAKYKNSIIKILTFGEASEKLVEELKDDFDIIAYANLDDLFNHIDCGEVVLFSPAFPSFDQYKKFSQRGEHFKTLFVGK